MNVLTVPRWYENDVKISQSGPLLARFGKNALVISGKTAFEKAGADLEQALSSEGIKYQVEIVGGATTREKMEHYALIAREIGADIVIGLGGGRIMDLAKAAAEEAGLSVISIPTVPATSACWSTLSVLYTDEGAEDEYFFREESPVLVLADKEVLKEAPNRYLFAGVADTIVKWYEITSNYNGNEQDLELRAQIRLCELILEFLEKDFMDAALKDPDNIPYSVWSNAIDSIFFLAGVVGSINGNVSYGGLAHHFYNQATHVPQTHIRLHGELVFYGLFMQLLIEGYERDDVKRRMAAMKQLGLPVTLLDMGITGDIAASAVRGIAERIAEHVPDYAPVDHVLTPETIEEAIYEVDKIGREL